MKKLPWPNWVVVLAQLPLKSWKFESLISFNGGHIIYVPYTMAISVTPTVVFAWGFGCSSSVNGFQVICQSRIWYICLKSHPLLNILECTGPGGYTSFMFHLTTTCCKIHHCHKRILIWSNFPPFMPIQSFCKIICHTNFGQNLMVLPFKWNLFERTERKHRSV